MATLGLGRALVHVGIYIFVCWNFRVLLSKTLAKVSLCLNCIGILFSIKTRFFSISY
jgi:hypothetical protein